MLCVGCAVGGDAQQRGPFFFSAQKKMFSRGGMVTSMREPPFGASMFPRGTSMILLEDSATEHANLVLPAHQARAGRGDRVSVPRLTMRACTGPNYKC